MTLEVPQYLGIAYRGWTWSPVAQYHPVTTAWKVQHPDGRAVYIKISAAPGYPRVLCEARRTEWASSFLPVPPVLDYGTDGQIDWLVTGALAGINAVDARQVMSAESLVPALANGLRRFHEAPVTDCPFDFRLDTALQHIQRRAASGATSPATDFHPEHAHLDVMGALTELVRLRPSNEQLVVCHGDYCFPNVLLQDGEVTGFLDMGELGVADRWWDLAVATWSVSWNIGPEWENLFLTTYGIEPDNRRIAFYRLLYDLTS